MQDAKEKLIEALEILAAMPNKDLKARMVKNQIAQVVQRHFPADRLTVARIINPARFAPKKREMTPQQVEESTYVYGAEHSVVFPGMEKKKAAAEETTSPSSDQPTDAELIESFGGLSEAKEWILDQGGRIAKNAGASKVASKIRKMTDDEK